MGRTKVKIQRISSMIKRQVTYSKRKAGLMKKAQELAILCNVDVAVLSFSPAGKPSLFVGDQSNLESVLNRYINLKKDERKSKRVSSVDTLQKIFKGKEHQIDRKKMLNVDENNQKRVKLNHQKRNLETKIVDLLKKLGPFSCPDCVTNPIQLKLIEQTMIQALEEIRQKKKTLIYQHNVTKKLQPISATESELLGKHNLQLSLGSIGNFEKTAGESENKNSKEKNNEKEK